MVEEWRAVVGYEGQYEVSNLGRVRSLDRTIPYTGGTHGESRVVRFGASQMQTVTLAFVSLVGSSSSSTFLWQRLSSARSLNLTR